MSTVPKLQGRGMTMSDQLARHAHKIPDVVALRFEGNGRTYAELCELLFTSMRGVAIVYAFEDRPAATDPHLALWKRLASRMLALDGQG